MKRKHRILSALTALALALGLCPVWALAAGTEASAGTAEALQAAVDAAVAAGGEQTITLTDDIEFFEEDCLEIVKRGDEAPAEPLNLTLNLGGHTLRSGNAPAIIVEHPGASLTVRSGTMEGGYSGIAVGAGSLTVAADAVVTGENGVYCVNVYGVCEIHVYGTVTGQEYGLQAAGGTLYLYHGAVITGGDAAIYLDGNPAVVLEEGAKAYIGEEEISLPAAGKFPAGTLVVCRGHQLGEWDENGERACTNCGYVEKAAARVEKQGGETVLAHSLQEAFAPENSGATVTMLHDVRWTGTYVEIKNGDFKLNLNGKTIANAVGPVFLINENGALQIEEGEGAILAEQSPTIGVFGKLTVNGGAIQTNGTRASVSAIDVLAGGTATINGGHIISRGDAEDAPALVAEEDAAALVTGGTFTGGLRARSGSNVQLRGGVFESAVPGGASVYTADEVTPLLGNNEAEDHYYAYFDADGSPVPGNKLDSYRLTGTVQVRECLHPAEAKGYTITGETHQARCTICGRLEDKEPARHAMNDEAPPFCDVCGYYPDPVMVAVDGGTPQYTTLEEAWAMALEERAAETVITLLADIPGDNFRFLTSLPAGHTVTLAGNGHNLGGYQIGVGGGTVQVNDCVLDWGAYIDGGEAGFMGCRFTGGRGEKSINIWGGTAAFTDCTFIDTMVQANDYESECGCEAAFTDCTFSGTEMYANYREYDAALQFTGCELRDSDLDFKTQSAEWTDCRLSDTRVLCASETAAFTDCDFTNGFVEAESECDAAFTRCRMSGNYTRPYIKADLPAVSVCGTAVFDDCTITMPRGSCIVAAGYPNAETPTGSVVTIRSGTYTTEDPAAAALTLRGGNAVLRGGEFSGAAAVEITREDGYGDPLDPDVTLPTLADLLGHTDTARYAYYRDGSPIEPPVGLKLTGSAAVRPCNHSARHVPGTLTHSLSCAFCGLTADAAPCVYEFDGNTGTCAACGHTLTVRLAQEPPVYDGTEKTPAVTVTAAGGDALTAGTDYTVTYDHNLRAGNGSFTVAIGANQGVCTGSFVIRPKPLTVTGASVRDRAYDGTGTVEVSGVALDGAVAGDDVSVDTAGLTGAVGGANAGVYDAVTLPALTLAGANKDNYALTQPGGAVETSVTIRKAAAPAARAGDLAVANRRAHTYTFGLGALRPELPDGMSFGSAPVTYALGAVSLGGYYAEGARIDSQTLTLPVQAVDSDAAGEIGTVTVVIRSENFEDITAVLHVRSVNKIIPTGAPALSADTLTYGQALSAIALSGGMTDGGTAVPGVFAWSSPENRPAAQEEYAAAWVFTPADNDTYAIVNGVSVIRVAPASLADAVVTLDRTAFRQDGEAHSPSVTGVTLGGVTLTEGTDYTAEIPAATDAGTYTVTVTGRGNYTGTAAAAFTVNPVETEEIEQKDDDGRDLRLEVETGISSVPAALAGKAELNTPAKIETALRTRVAEVLDNVGEQLSVFDVVLQYKDESGVWQNVDPANFPEDGVTAILPYPAGTGRTGFRFTVQHLISSGENAGTMETLDYTLTETGLQCRFHSLSPVAIGYESTASTSSGGGGSGGYAVTVERTEHGRVTASPSSAGRGSTVTLTVTPDSGYALGTLTVTDSRGGEVRLTAAGGKYTFTMPAGAVTVKASFVPAAQTCDGGENCPSHGLTDLGGADAWYHEAVDYVLRSNLMRGYSDGRFGPDDSLSRAQLAQILYNRAGGPAVTGGAAFADAAAGAWYADAVAWAAAQNVVSGYGDGRFGPDDPVTREQLAVMLWRHAGSPAAAGKALEFADAGKISDYALDALRWAVEQGILSGRGGGVLDPQGKATRAEAAAMLTRYWNA